MTARGAREYTIDGEWSGSRVDRFVRAVVRGIPYGTLQMLFRKGSIRLNGKRTRGSARLTAGDIISLDASITAADPAGIGRPEGSADRRDSRREPDGIPLALARFGLIGEGILIVHEDDDLLVLVKPPGLVVQPGNRSSSGSLLDILDAYRVQSGEAGSSEIPFPYTPVHRLDRETSGLLVVAKTRSAARSLSESFSSGLVEKTYLAVTERPPRPPSGTIDAPIRVRKGSSSRAGLDAGGKRAVTSYRTVRALPGGRALVEARIHTGRTHQIRVHLASIGSPILGDSRYGTPRSGRLRLHAWKLRLPRPYAEGLIELEAPPPADFESSY